MKATHDWGRYYKESIKELEAKIRYEQLSFSQPSNKSKQYLKEISNTNINIAESYAKLKIELLYRLNKERIQKMMM
jgi:hypothetical protein